MTDLTEHTDIDRARRFVQSTKKAQKETDEKKIGDMLVKVCCRLAPLFQEDPGELSELWVDCREHEEKPLAAFEEELLERGMQQITVKPGLKDSPGLFKIITEIKGTTIWKQFLARVKETGQVILVFKPAGIRKLWVMTNSSIGRRRSFVGRILIPIKDAPDVCIMPFKEYLEENTCHEDP